MADGMTYSSDESRKVMQIYGALSTNKEGYLSVSLQEMLTILEQMERLRVAWKAAEEKASYHEQLNAKSSSEIESLSSQLRRCNAELTDARAQIRAQLQEAHAMRADLDETVDRLKLVKELLKVQHENIQKLYRVQNHVKFLRGLVRFLCTSRLLLTHSSRRDRFWSKFYHTNKLE
ncbi:hypothetical protein COOONC_16274 [Cooperia oncophora]